MVKSKRPLIFQVIAPIIVFIITIAAAIFMVRNKPELASRPLDAAIPLVETIEVELRTLPISIFTQGTVEASHISHVTSEVSGRIVWVSEHFKDGNLFPQGEEIIRIEAIDYEAAEAQAIANLSEAELQYKEEQTRSEQAKADWQTAQRLQPGTKRKATDLALRKPYLSRALANVKARQSQLDLARKNLLRTRITAPFTGIIAEKAVESGQFVTVGTPIAKIHAAENAEIRLPLSRQDFAKLDNNGLAAQVLLKHIDNDTQYSWQGSIARIQKNIDTKTRQQYAIAHVPDPYNLKKNYLHELPLGSFVSAEISAKHLINVAQLPRVALHEGNYIYVVSHSDQLQRIAVSIFHQTEAFIYVKNKLQHGDKVVVTHLPIMADKMKVKAQQSSVRWQR